MKLYTLVDLETGKSVGWVMGEDMANYFYDMTEGIGVVLASKKDRAEMYQASFAETEPTPDPDKIELGGGQ